MHRTVSPTLALAVSVALAGTAHAGSRCDLLPASGPKVVTKKVPGEIIEAQCRVPGTPMNVRSGTAVPGGVLQFVDGWHGECELFRNGKGTGEGKGVSVCPPTAKWFKGSDGVAVCQWPDRVESVTVNEATPRRDCYAGMQLAVERIFPQNIELPPLEKAQHLASPVEVARAFPISIQGKDVDATQTVRASFAPQWFKEAEIPVAARLSDDPKRPAEFACTGNCQTIYLAPPNNLPDGTIRVDLVPPAPARGVSFMIKVRGAERRLQGAVFCPVNGAQPSITGSGTFEVLATRHPNNGVPVTASVVAVKPLVNSSGQWSVCPGVALPNTPQTFSIRNVGNPNASIKLPEWTPANASSVALVPNAGKPWTFNLPPGKWAIDPVPASAAYPVGYALLLTYRE
jgi:hypothetical protein